MRKIILAVLLTSGIAQAQVPVSTKGFDKNSGVVVSTDNKKELSIKWPAGNNAYGQLVIDLEKNAPLLKSIGVISAGQLKEIARNLDPAFVLTIGKRDLVSQNGWNIFFDKVPLKPHRSYVVNFNKASIGVRSLGSRTIITIGAMDAAHFSGDLEITLYNGAPLLNLAAVLSTQNDSTAIVYDAGLVGTNPGWKTIAWANVEDQLESIKHNSEDTSRSQAVKYRTIIGENKNGSIAIFPAPHQYFYPLDEAFNLKFTWHGSNYRKLIRGYGLGIRQDLHGDNRYVPWFNAPPFTKQRLNFYCYLSSGDASAVLQDVKKYTRSDTYLPLPEYKTLTSHYHNEFIMKVVLANSPVPDSPNFVKVFKNMGIDIVHLGEFHYTAHPKGPVETRLNELHALFEQCKRLSTDKFLLLPGEEPNEFLGGHWLAFFPKPVYWIMSRQEGHPMVTKHPKYGTVYHIGNAREMLQLLEKEKGLAWTAHPRTKGSTGYPDKYKNEPFFLSDHFLGAAWKPIPADLSLPRLGKRVLDLMDDMNNWGLKKNILAEADLFTIEPENEMYAHMNVNYLQIDKLPPYNNGWQTVLDVLRKGRFFSTTGEVLIPSFKVNGVEAGDTVQLNNQKSRVTFQLQWTFPMEFAEIISGDGVNVYRHKIDLTNTFSFGMQNFEVSLDLSGKKWVRLEAWDAAVNGAYTQTIQLQ